MALIFTILASGRTSFFGELCLQIINMGFFAVVVYFNLYYLFPRYLKDKKILNHLLFLAMSSAVITPINVFALVSFAGTEAINNEIVYGNISTFISKFLIAGISSVYYIINDWMNVQKEKQELTNQTLQSELKFLKSQINPHFLFNTLNSLYALTLKKSDLAPDIVLKLSEMMRYMLYECNEKIVPLEKEVNYLINYLELEKVRHGKKINITFNQSGEIANQMIAPLMFIPFIENCFKHGVSNQIAEAFVNINLIIMRKEVEIHIENSKHAMMPGVHSKKSGGIGLQNVKRRLDLLYPDAYKLDIIDSPITYKVILNIKLN
jgi:two-component system, LytTR family, sensor kinase